MAIGIAIEVHCVGFLVVVGVFVSVCILGVISGGNASELVAAVDEFGYFV
jgi:hypothetical protein